MQLFRWKALIEQIIDDPEGFEEEGGWGVLNTSVSEEKKVDTSITTNDNDSDDDDGAEWVDPGEVSISCLYEG